MPEPSESRALTMYTVYRHPRDYPGKWVVRKWSVDGSDPWGTPALNPSIVADTLEEARSVVPPGLVRMGRWEGDDPAIHEVWL